MKKILIASALVVCFATAATAQENDFTPSKRNCGSNDKYLEMLKTDPQFALNRKNIEDFTQNFIRNNGGAQNKTQAPIYTIPVVVHVVYKTTTQNISDAQIQSQMTVLNKDFQKLNSDVTKVPSVWTSLVADCQIQFCLATSDPSGNPTTGIVRKSTTKASFSTNDAVKKSTQGGDNAWDATKYLNIWVCNLGSGLLGYAQFPGGPASTDGVVIDYAAFGTIGTAAYPFNLGRSATHEIGHWLNLYHIWGDDGTGCSGSDLVGDTPNAGGPNYGCPAFPHVTCSNGPNGDMWMNYMDYSDDRCMYMFSNGQNARVSATLATGGAHHSVTVSGKCGTKPAAVPANVQISKVSLSVVPNPVQSGTPSVSYKLGVAGNMQLTVTTSYGAPVSSINLGKQAQGEYKIQRAELARLQNGVYVVTLTADGVIVGSTQLVVQH